MAIFVTGLATALIGTVFADQQVTVEEKQGLQTTLSHIIPTGNPLRQLVPQILKGVQGHQIHRNKDDLAALLTPLNQVERLLLIGLAYRASVSDGEMAPAEVEYLRSFATELGISSRHEAVLEAAFGGQLIEDTAALQEVCEHLEGLTLEESEPLFTNAAKLLLDELPSAVGTQETWQGSLELRQSAERLQQIVQAGLEELRQVTELLNSKPRLAAINPQSLWIRVAEASGRYVKLSEVQEPLRNRLMEQVNTTWQPWLDGVQHRMRECWSSGNSDSSSAEALAQQFSQELKSELGQWLNGILKQHLRLVDELLAATGESLSLLHPHIADTVSPVLATIPDIQQTFENPLHHIPEHLIKSDAEFDLKEFAGDVTNSIAGALGGFAGALNLNINTSQVSLRQRVFEKGWERFSKTSGKIVEQLNESLPRLLHNYTNSVLSLLEQALSLYEGCLEIQSRDHRETSEQRDAEKAWVASRQAELLQIQDSIAGVLS